MRSVLSLIAFLMLAGVSAAAMTAEDIHQAARSEEGEAAKEAVKQPDPAVVKAQVLLVRRHISPGEVDGMDGENYRKAVAQFRRQEGLGEGDQMDEATWQRLGADASSGIMSEYVLTRKDVRTRLARRIPQDYSRQARMKRLAYTSMEEMLAERFHMSPKLLKALNPDASFRKAGERIVIVKIERQPLDAKIQRLEAIKSTGMVVAYGPHDEPLASFPATIGSEENYDLQGEHEIKRIARHPTYHYDPEKNFQQGNNKRKLVLPAGPNNPVGTVWIALSKPTFGIHGTPEPSKVSKTSSNGCVRMTNWDAESLAGMVKPGMKVRFVP